MVRVSWMEAWREIANGGRMERGREEVIKGWKGQRWERLSK